MALGATWPLAEMGGTWAVFAGGGTGGHLYPGLAVARQLVERGHDPASIRFVGARRGLEAKTRATEGFPTTLLPGRGLKRPGPRKSIAALQDLAGNGGALLGSLVSVGMALRLFATWRPAVVVSLGGYASLPPVAAAMVFRVPIVVVNVDAVPGAVNRLAARVAAVCAAGSADVKLPRAVFTGVPVRAELAALERGMGARRRAREKLGLPVDAKVVVVSGGSLGSYRINQATAQLVRLWSAKAGVAVRHVVGRRDWARFRDLQLANDRLIYQQVPYEDDMACLYQAADVAVQRAGASTVAELALAGVPSVLVPLPGSPGDHQGANARAMAKIGAAVVVPDGELDGHRLASELSALLDSADRLAKMGEAALELAKPDAAAHVADLVEHYAASPASGAARGISRSGRGPDG